MTTKSIHKDTTGQAMVEFVIVSFPLVIMLLSIIFICDAYIIKQKTIVAARYGTWRMAQGKNVNKETIKKDIVKYYFAKNGNGTEFTQLGTSAGNEIFNDTLDFANAVFAGSGYAPLKAKYAVSYTSKHPIPQVMKNTRFPETFTVSSSHEVDGNSWNANDTDVHELFNDGASKFIKQIASFF